MEPLSVSASIIAVIQLTSSIISICYDYHIGVKSASKEADRILHSVTDLQNILRNLLESFEQQPSCDKTNLKAFSILVAPDGPITRLKEILLDLKRKVKPQEGWRSVRHSLTWPLQAKEMKKMVQSLEAVKSNMNLAMTSDNLNLSLQTQKDVHKLSKDLSSFEISHRFQHIIDKLAAPDAFYSHLECRKRIRSDTSHASIIETPELQTWLEQPSTLWLKGPPGCGKTMIASSIIEHVKHSKKALNSNTSLAYFYFDFRDESRTKFESLILSLISQLLLQTENEEKFLASLTENPDHVAAIRSSPTSHLKTLLMGFENSYLILDALDECNDTEELARWLWNMSSCTQDAKFHVLITSQMVPLLLEKQVAESPSVAVMLVDEKRIENDLSSYLDVKMTTHLRMKYWPAEMRQEVKTYLLDNSNGIFRWVECQLETLSSLRRSSNMDSVRPLLSSLPRTLEDSYKKIVERIEDQYVEDVQTLLGITMFAIRPLLIQEFIDIFMTLKHTESWSDKEIRLLDFEDILRQCSSLVTVSADESMEEGKAIDHEACRVQLAHSSVRDFLLSQASISPCRTKFSLEGPQVHQSLAEICIDYLIKICSCSRQEDFPDSNFVSYAAFLWTYHFSKAPLSSKGDLEERAFPLFEPNSKLFDSYGQILDRVNPLQWVPGKGKFVFQKSTPLLLAVDLGLMNISVRLVEMGQDPRTKVMIDKGNFLDSPLEAAAAAGEVPLVKFFLQEKFNLCSNRQIMGNAFGAAAARGELEVMDLILETGIEVDMALHEPALASTALAIATVQMQKTACEKLLDHGAEPQKKYDDSLSPMQYATLFDKLEIVELFLQYEQCDLDLCIGQVAEFRNEVIFKALFDRCTSIKGPTKAIQAAFSAAVESKWADMMIALCAGHLLTDGGTIDLSIYLSTPPEVLRSALWDTSLTTTSTMLSILTNKQIIFEALVVSLFLDESMARESQGFDVMRLESNCVYLMFIRDMLASFDESEFVLGPQESSKIADFYDGIEAMLNKARNISFAPRSGAHRGIQSAFITLIEWIDYKQLHVQLDPPLYKALVDFLCFLGADIESKLMEGEESRNLLHVCCWHGHRGLAEYLLQRGANVNALTAPYRYTPLTLVACNGHVSIMEMLLDSYHEDLSLTTSFGFYPIHGAAAHGYVESVQVLVDRGSPIDHRDLTGMTALHWAARAKAVAVVKYLVAIGADTTAKEYVTGLSVLEVVGRDLGSDNNGSEDDAEEIRQLLQQS